MLRAEAGCDARPYSMIYTRIFGSAHLATRWGEKKEAVCVSSGKTERGLHNVDCVMTVSSVLNIS